MNSNLQDILYEFEEIDSTNLEAKRMIDLGVTHKSFIVSSKKQSAGRGRLDRSWVSLEGNIHASFVLHEEFVQNVYSLPFVAPLAVLESITCDISRDVKSKIKFKWPNDMLIYDGENAAKFCGILIERHREFFIIGIGINVIASPEYEMLYKTTSLFTYGMSVSVPNIYHNLMKILRFKPDDIKVKWLHRAFKLGEMIQINGTDGIFAGINDSFEIILKRQDGSTKTFSYGDVS
jgi:BirA family biotin operon repressor/biotin-[acetyl-CoA-carboxylase] ligase